MIKESWEDIKILINSDINELCNKGRYNDARELENARDIIETALKLAYPTIYEGVNDE